MVCGYVPSIGQCGVGGWLRSVWEPSVPPNGLGCSVTISIRRYIGTVLSCDYVMAAEAQPMKVGVIPSVTPFIVCHLPPLISAFYHAHFAPPTSCYVTVVHRPLTLTLVIHSFTVHHLSTVVCHRKGSWASCTSIREFRHLASNQSKWGSVQKLSDGNQPPPKWGSPIGAAPKRRP